MTSIFQEHAGYLADARRLERYRTAISQVVRPGETVADLGCGFGILGLLYLRAGASQVWGIDRTNAIDIARETLTRTGLGNRYHCVRDRTFRAVLPDRVDRLVCDHVGYFGIDYGIIELMADARRRLLKPGGQIMPRRIRLMLAAVSSPLARVRIETWDGESMPHDYRWLRSYEISSRHAITCPPEDICSEPAVLDTIDLASDVADYLSYQTVLHADRDAAIDGWLGWFECELAEGVWMTNSPLAADRIDRDQAFLPFATAIAVKAGEAIEARFSFRHQDGIAAWAVRAPADGRWLKQNSWQSRMPGHADLKLDWDRPRQLSPEGRARQTLASLVDGQRSAREIEEALMAEHPGLFPCVDELRRFIRREIARSTE